MIHLFWIVQQLEFIKFVIIDLVGALTIEVSWMYTLMVI